MVVKSIAENLINYLIFLASKKCNTLLKHEVTVYFTGFSSSGNIAGIRYLFEGFYTNNEPVGENPWRS
jgi:hypothetical protein